jgi:hypothetical protein
MSTKSRLAGIAVAAAMSAGTFTISPPQAQAAFIMTMTESGGNVVVTGSGSINLAGLTVNHGDSDQAAVWPGEGTIIAGPTSFTSDTYFYGPIGPTTTGSGGLTLASSGSGDLVGFSGSNDIHPEIDLPAGYVTNTPLSDTATFDGATFASLGITPGTYIWYWGSTADGTYDTFTLQVGVPEPATALLIGLPVAAIMLARRRAKAAQA